MNNKDLIIIALVIAIIYLYYRQTKKYQQLHSATSDLIFNSSENSETKIFELDEDLIADRDAAVRAKNEAEQEVRSLSTQLRNKQKEVSNKDDEIQRLKKEKSDSEIALNKKITELKKELRDIKPSEWLTNRVTELETSLRTKESKIQDLEKTIRELQKKK